MKHLIIAITLAIILTSGTATADTKSDFLAAFGLYQADGVWIRYQGQDVKISNDEILQMGADDLRDLATVLTFKAANLPPAVLDAVIERVMGE